jgi:hypothetical protein
MAANLNWNRFPISPTFESGLKRIIHTDTTHIQTPRLRGGFARYIGGSFKYTSFVYNVIDVNEEKGMPPISRVLIEAAWCQKLSVAFFLWAQTNAATNGWGSSIERRHQMKMLASAFDEASNFL